jgi:hypothetical protein
VKAYAGGAIVATLPDPSKATMRKAISRLFTTAFYCRGRCLSSLKASSASRYLVSLAVLSGGIGASILHKEEKNA